MLLIMNQRTNDNQATMNGQDGDYGPQTAGLDRLLCGTSVNDSMHFNAIDWIPSYSLPSSK